MGKNTPSMAEALAPEISVKSPPVTIKDNDPGGVHTFTFKISKAEAWEFKQWCTLNEMKYVEGFRKGFELLKREFGK